MRHPKKAVAHPSPSPAATPAIHKHRAKPGTAQPAPSPGATPGDEAAPQATPANAETAPGEEATPGPKSKHKPGGMTSQVPFVPPTEAQEAPVVETKSPAEQEAEESSRFQAAKAKALEDQHVMDLQAKADESTGDDARAASRRYYRALYDRMREIDPSLNDRIDRTEAATLRRVEEENTQ